MNETQMVVPQITEYLGKRVLTTAQMAECYGVKRNTIVKNFERNRDKYVDGVHFLCLEGEEKREFLNRRQNVTGSKNAGKIYLWSERGVLLHAKSLNSDKAWAVYEKLVDFYFHTRQQSSFDGSKLPEEKILASELYSYLGLSRGNYWQWVERNITQNRFAVEDLDYRYIGGNDFILSRSFVQCMCMTSKTDEGERCRQEYIRKLEEYEAVLSALGIRRKEQLTMAELEQRDNNPLIALDFGRIDTPAAGEASTLGIADKRLLSLKEFCIYAGIGMTKARKYAEENNLIMRIGKRVLVDRIRFDRLCDRREK